MQHDRSEIMSGATEGKFDSAELAVAGAIRAGERWVTSHMSVPSRDKNNGGSSLSHSMDSHRIKPNRKRPVSSPNSSMKGDDEVVVVAAGQEDNNPAMGFTAANKDMVVLGPLPSFRSKTPMNIKAEFLRKHGNFDAGASNFHRADGSVASAAESHAVKNSINMVKTNAGNTVEGSHSHHSEAIIFAAPADRPQAGHLHLTQNRSDFETLHRPRKQSKQELLDNLKSYEYHDSDEDDFQEDEGDVSGEDVFSDDEDVKPAGHLKLNSVSDASMSGVDASPFTYLGQVNSLNTSWGESHQKITPPQIAQEGAGQTHSHSRFGHRRLPMCHRETEGNRKTAQPVTYGTAEQKQISLGYQHSLMSDREAEWNGRLGQPVTNEGAGPRKSYPGYQQPHISDRKTKGASISGQSKTNEEAGQKQPCLGYQHSKLSHGQTHKTRERGLLNKGRGQEQPLGYHSLNRDVGRGLFNGPHGQKQPFLGPSPPTSRSSHRHPSHDRSSHASRDHSKMKMASSRPGKIIVSDRNWGAGASRSKNTGYSVSESSREASTKVHQHFSKSALYLSLTKQQERFASFEVKVTENQGLNDSQNSPSTSAKSGTYLTANNAVSTRTSQGQESVKSSRSPAVASFSAKDSDSEMLSSNGCNIFGGGTVSTRARHNTSLNEIHRRAKQTFPSTHTTQNSRSSQRGLSRVPLSRHNSLATAALSNSASVNMEHKSMESSTSRQPSRTVDNHGQPQNVIANMEDLWSQSGGSASVNGRGKSRSSNSVSHASFSMRTSTIRGGGSLRPPSRDIIASIEADMMRLEEDEAEESNMDTGNHGSHEMHAQLVSHRSNIHLGSTQDRRQLAGISQRDVLSVRLIQQQQHLQQGMSQHSNGNRSLTNQISNMAIHPYRLERDEDSVATSINSCASYEKKCTNIFATRALSHIQELGCIELNIAICDLYGAPVGKILRKYPGVTRVVRAEDETGNVQLHYAVRHGNVKAIRRIVRSDPGCAMIRNIHGYCPLHLAVQIGNFAVVQLLCCMVPTSAEVQCEEGCLPLHEAVSSAAHFPDAPQIVAALINAFPSAIKITNDEGLMPLHLAAISGFSAGVRTVFAYGFSTIYARENTEEMLPLDFAVDGHKASSEELLTNQSEASAAVLIQKEKEFRQCIGIFLVSALYGRPVLTLARRYQRGSAFLPIHGAATALPCLKSWQHILGMYGRDCASDVDVRGRTALHVLVASAVSAFFLPVVTKMIVDINGLDPTSSTTFDDSGLIPLHAALVYSAPYIVIEHLLTCNGSTISMQVDEDCDNVQLRGMLPFQLAALCNCSIDIVNLLLRAHPIGVLGAVTND